MFGTAPSAAHHQANACAHQLRAAMFALVFRKLFQVFTARRFDAVTVKRGRPRVADPTCRG